MGTSAEHFRQNLRRLRTQNGGSEDGHLSQQDLADRIGVHRNYVGMMERGERKPALDTLDAIARELGVPSYELLRPPSEAQQG